MIYTLTYSFADENNVVQWYNLVNEYDYLDIVNLYHVKGHNLDKNIMTTYEYFNKNIDNSFGVLQESNSILLVDNEYIHNEFTKDTNEIISNISKLNDSNFDKVLIISKDHFIHEDYSMGKVEIISPNQQSDYEGTLRSKFNYYLVNAGFNKIYNTSFEVFNSFKFASKHKKSSLLMGSFKPSRTILYNSIKKHNMIDDMYLSYMSYNNGDVDSQYKEHFLSNGKYDKEKLLDLINQEEYRSLKKDLPIFLDGNYEEDNFNVSPPLPYLMNSYVQIVDCNALNSKYLYTDEKVFRPFLTFNIPIFFGQRGLHSVLKNYGFDVFEDIFDIQRDGDADEIERFKCSFENVKKIHEMSYGDLQFLYIINHQRLIHNYKKLRELGDIHISELIKQLDEYN